MISLHFSSFFRATVMALPNPVRSVCNQNFSIGLLLGIVYQSANFFNHALDMSQPCWELKLPGQPRCSAPDHATGLRNKPITQCGTGRGGARVQSASTVFDAASPVSLLPYCMSQFSRDGR
jgi:hypothetical protein